MSKITTYGYFDLLEALREPGCAVCRLLKRDIERHLGAILYEFVLDHGVSGRFREARGLCSEHGYLLTERGNALGIATLYHAVLYDLLADTERMPARAPRLFGGDRANAAPLEPKAPCSVCVYRDETAARLLALIPVHIHENEFRETYSTSSGLCLPHVTELVKASTPAVAQQFMTLQRPIWERLKAELETFMRRSDFQYAHETIGTEGDSWRRATALISGERGVARQEK